MMTMGAMEFGVFVRRTRRSLDVKQEDLAKRLGVSQAAVSDIERGDRRTIDEGEVERVVRALCAGIQPPPDAEVLIEEGLREAGILRLRRDLPEIERIPDEDELERRLAAYDGPNPGLRAAQGALAGFLHAVRTSEKVPPPDDL